MKKLILILVCLCPLLAAAQLKDSVFVKFPMDDAGNVVYSETVDTKLSKEQIFKNAVTWIAKNHGDYKAVIQVQDMPTGTIVYKARSVFDKRDEDTMDAITYTVQIDVKPQKFRVKISDINAYMYTSFMPVDKRESIEPLEKYYARHTSRTDAYAFAAPGLIRKKDAQVKDLLQRIKQSLQASDDF